MIYNLKVLKRNLHKRGFNTEICENLLEAKTYLINQFFINNETVIGMGNSLTLEAIGIKTIWQEKTNFIYQHDLNSSDDETRKALLSDLYLTSANAISYDGQIINIDGTGNRTAATCYGPKEVIYVISKNKIALNLEKAIERARNIAAVQNAKRYNRKTPCSITGKCEDCLSPECICSIMTIHRRKPIGAKMSVILINEDTGF